MRKFSITILAILSISLLMLTCDLDDLNGSNNVPLYAQAKKTIPAITKSKSDPFAGVSRADWSNLAENPYYNAYKVFQSYTFPDDEGQISTENIYKLLFEAGRKYEDAKVEATAFAAPTTISATFNLGNTAQTYTHGLYTTYTGSPASGGIVNYQTSLAIKQEGGWDYLVTAFNYTDDTSVGYNLIEAKYQEPGGDIVLDYVERSEFSGGTLAGQSFAQRNEIEGNMTSHSFYVQVKTSYCWIVGKGISQGADNYYVIYFSNGSGTSGYFKVPADSDENWYFANKDTPLEANHANLAGDTAAYATWINDTIIVPGRIFNVNTDIPGAMTDFANSNVLTLP